MGNKKVDHLPLWAYNIYFREVWYISAFPTYNQFKRLGRIKTECMISQLVAEYLKVT